MKDKIKAVLEELTQSIDWQYEGAEEEALTKAQLQLDALYKEKYLEMLPKEKTIQEMLDCLSTKDESVDTLLEKHTKIATITGFNSAIQEIRNRVKGSK